MAKISSYPSDANVTTSDRLIGSDNENSNETKNFSVGDIINLAASIIVPPGGFVPYTGATANVDLGGFGLTTSYLTSNLGMFIDGAISLNGDEGNTGEVLVSQGPGATPSWASLSGTYVPYTGATGNVDLGSNSLDADVINAGDVYANNLFNAVGNPLVFVGNDSNNPVGLSIDTSTNVFRLGDYNGNFNATHINIEDSSSRITFVGGFNLSNGQGTAGQVLTSTGSGTTPQWTSLPSTSGFVPYTGATTGVNLGIYSLTAANVNANNVVPVLGGSGNIYLGGAGGYGVAQNGVYCVGTNTTILGNSLPGSSTNLEISASGTSFTFNNGYVNLGGTNGLVLLNGSGSTGEVLICSGASSAPLWSNAAELATNTFWKGSFYDTITQTLTGGANVEVPIILRSTDVTATNGVSVVTDGTNLTRITFANGGTYNILFSAQLANSAGTSQTVDFWLRKNGSTAAANIANTNGKVLLQGNANYLMAAWNYFVTVNAGDYIQLMWTATSTNITMVYEAATAVHPATPSVIVTVNLV